MPSCFAYRSDVFSLPHPPKAQHQGTVCSRLNHFAHIHTFMYMCVYVEMFTYKYKRRYRYKYKYEYKYKICIYKYIYIHVHACTTCVCLRSIPELRALGGDGFLKLFFVPLLAAS